MKTAVAEARAAVARALGDAAATVVGAWPVGIIGLVAGRLAEERGRPAVVGAELGDVVRGSCRSDGSSTWPRPSSACADLLIRHGGHPGAAGLRAPGRRAGTSSATRFLVLAASRGPPGPAADARVDLASAALDVDYALYRELARLDPCGPGNPDPLVAVLGLTVTRVRAATGGHTQLDLRRERDVLDGIAFGRPDLAEVVREGDRVDVVARLTQPDVRRLRVAPARGPRRGAVREPRRDGCDPCCAVDPGAGAGRERVMTMAPNPSPRSGLAVGSPGRWLAPVLSIVGLLLVAFVTLNLLNGQLPFVGSSSGNGNGNGNGNSDGGPDVTPAPSNKVVIPQEVVSFKGSILYVKAGNVWVQTGKEAHQLTSSGTGSMPSWSPDGTTVYFVRTTDGTLAMAVRRRPPRLPAVDTCASCASRPTAAAMRRWS